MYIIMYFNIWYFFFSILLILLISKNTTTTNYVLCTWSLNNTVWARYIMKCIIRSISLWTELISRHYFRIFLFNNLHSFSQDSAYLSTTYLYSKTKKNPLEYEQVKNVLNISITFTTIFIHVLDTYMACIFCLISIYILFEMKFCTLWDLSTLLHFLRKFHHFGEKSFHQTAIQFQEYKMLLVVHTNFKLIVFSWFITVLFSNPKPFKTNILYA